MGLVSLSLSCTLYNYWLLFFSEVNLSLIKSYSDFLLKQAVTNVFGKVTERKLT